MSLHFRILGSGSSGNCALLRTEDSCVLIDAGFSARRLGQMLAECGESLQCIQAIFLTHEHSDHAAALDGLRKFPQIRIFANEATAAAAGKGLSYRPSWQIFQTGNRFAFQDLSIRPFSIPHDAREPVGFQISCGQEDDLFTPRRTLTWATDLGHAPLNVLEPIRECDLLVLEANYCPELLKADTKRPWAIKQRINGRHGHLSNPDMATLLSSLANPRWKHILLAHLSGDCNSPDAVESTLSPLRATLPGCQFTIVPSGGCSPLIEL